MIAGIGFAVMAAKLARIRNGPGYERTKIYASRADVDATPEYCYPVHREYFRILDQAALRVGLALETTQRTGHMFTYKVYL